jgi:hypothetical protein
VRGQLLGAVGERLEWAGEHSAVSVRPARRGPASGGREGAGGPGRAVGPLDCVKPIEGIAHLGVRGIVEVGVGPLLLSVGLHVGHRRRARGRGSGELRGLSAREDVGGRRPVLRHRW